MHSGWNRWLRDGQTQPQPAITCFTPMLTQAQYNLLLSDHLTGLCWQQQLWQLRCLYIKRQCTADCTVLFCSVLLAACSCSLMALDVALRPAHNTAFLSKHVDSVGGVTVHLKPCALICAQLNCFLVLFWIHTCTYTCRVWESRGEFWFICVVSQHRYWVQYLWSQTPHHTNTDTLTAKMICDDHKLVVYRMQTPCLCAVYKRRAQCGAHSGQSCVRVGWSSLWGS